MTRSRWQKVSQVYHDALERSESDRPAFLAEACASDEGLRAEVESLLAEVAPAAFLEHPLSGVAVSATGLGVVSLTGRDLGSYHVNELIGEGGMGQVYRARDTKLDRDVALKMLPGSFINDPQRLQRFEREARVLASLNHPHVGAIYGVEESEGVRFLVLELVEGQTLATRVERKGLAVSEALTIARQIADALDAAHEKGIVHRDLKPANIILQGTPSEYRSRTSLDINAKVLDFGLAKWAPDDSAESPGPADDVVKTTREGAILGTVAYMSPEQARGQKVDKRSDIWAFGCLLYEMLTSEPPFAGETGGDLLAAILKQEPDWTRLPAETPARIRRLIVHCLNKDPKHRLRDIGDAKTELDDVLGVPLGSVSSASPWPESSSGRPAEQPRRSRFTAVAMIALAFAGALGAVAVWLMNPRSGPATQYQFTIVPPPGTRLVSLETGGPPAVSSDGQTTLVAFVAADSAGQTSVWIRRLDALESTRLSGTEGGSHPFWSPDGRSIAFFKPGKLMRVALDGGPARDLANAPHGRGGSWSRDDVIVFTPDFTEGLFRISADGRNLERLTSPDFSRRETSHRWPVFLPDGRRFVFLVRSDQSEVQGVYLGSLDTKGISRLINIPSSAVFAASPGERDGYLVFEQRGILSAQALSLSEGRMSGEIFPIARLPPPNEDTSVVPAAASANGVLVHESGSVSQQNLVWVDRDGGEQGVIPAEGQYRNPRLSPDRQKIVIEKQELQTGRSGIWLFDLDRSMQHRLIDTPEAAFSPVWSPDGQNLLFVSYRGTQWDLIRRHTINESDVTVLRTTGQAQAVTDSSKDGRWIVYQERGAGATDQWDIGVFDTTTSKAQTLVASDKNEHQAQLSPDGAWLAYTSNELGRDQVYLLRFPQLSPKIQVSAAGGSEPKWRADGRELFYISPNQEMMSVSVNLASSPPVQGSNRVLFRANLATPKGIFSIATYDVDAEGSRFLIQTPPRVENIGQQISVNVNWRASR
jgi:serine/threonine protein kinase